MVQELHDIKSIFDFLYLDNTKIKSFYAQLTGLGALTNVKENDEVNIIQNKDAGIGVPSVATAKIAHQEGTKRAGERLYDAIPTMPREMINRLDELGFIERGLSEKTAGKLVLLKGKLSITDIGSLKDLIEPTLNFEAYERAKSERSSSKQKAVLKQIQEEYKPGIDIIKVIPYALEATLHIGNDTVWMTLNRDEMVGNPHDINLKHGNMLYGDYYVLGVLDAIPHDEQEIASVENELKNGVKTFVNELKMMIGRNPESYGITPIAIFRVIRSNKQ